MGEVKLADIFLSCELLLEQQRYAQVVQVLGKTSSTFTSAEEREKLLSFLKNIPQSYRLEDIEAAGLYAKALKWTKRFDKLSQWAARVTERHGIDIAAPVQLEWAGGLLTLERYKQAWELLNKIIPNLSGEALGIAWANLGLSAFHIGKLWQNNYIQARPLLSGEALGRILLDEGFCFVESGFYLEARQSWLEALSHFKNNSYFAAWTRYNLGLTALRVLELESERHFLEAARLTQSPKAASLRSAVLRGLAASRRMLGEWNRAETAYREALHIASEAHDKEQSYLGLIRSLRLSGRVSEALETLELALHEDGLEPTMLHVAKTFALLKLGQTKQAREALDKVGTVRGEADGWLRRIAKAELARQEGRPEEAVGLLEGLPLHTLHSREEVRQWPQLFALLGGAGKPVPQPLEYVQGTTVQVRAQGVLQVRVNGRTVTLLPAGRPGELLVFLLEGGGEASVEAIGEALYPSLSEAKRRRGTVWKLVNSLREALGWEGSVQALGGAYRLDPGAQWVYDVAEARARREFSGEFLAGVYSEWALEVGRELQDLGAGKARLELN